MSLTKGISVEESRAVSLSNALKRQFNMLHSMDFYDDYEIEKLLLKQKELELHYIKNRFQLPKDMVVFSPSSSDKCARELFFKANRMPKDEQTTHPYQKRWTRNSTAVHEAVQRDLLYMEKHIEYPTFTVSRMTTGLQAGLPAWEKNIQRVKVIEHNGVTFALYGMCDGVLKHKDGSFVGFEFKTKSTRQDTVHKLKKASPSHIQQTVAYSILLSGTEATEGQPLDEFLITYESVSKDEWKAGFGAYEDIKPFYHKVTESQRIKLLDRFAEIAEQVENGELPEQETNKCIFCPYKGSCLL